jgi:hypothetical protein
MRATIAAKYGWANTLMIFSKTLSKIDLLVIWYGLDELSLISGEPSNQGTAKHRVQNFWPSLQDALISSQIEFSWKFIVTTAIRTDTSELRFHSYASHNGHADSMSFADSERFDLGAYTDDITKANT